MAVISQSRAALSSVGISERWNMLGARRTMSDALGYDLSTETWTRRTSGERDVQSSPTSIVSRSIHCTRCAELSEPPPPPPMITAIAAQCGARDAGSSFDVTTRCTRSLTTHFSFLIKNHTQDLTSSRCFRPPTGIEPSGVAPPWYVERISNLRPTNSPTHQAARQALQVP